MLGRSLKVELITPHEESDRVRLPHLLLTPSHRPLRLFEKRFCLIRNPFCHGFLLCNPMLRRVFTNILTFSWSKNGIAHRGICFRVGYGGTGKHAKKIHGSAVNLTTPTDSLHSHNSDHNGLRSASFQRVPFSRSGTATLRFERVSNFTGGEFPGFLEE